MSNSLKSTARVIGRVSFIQPIRYTKTGKAIFSFTVGWKESQAATEWSNVKINVWGDNADSLAGNLRDGDTVGVSGDLQVRSFVDKTGAKRTSVEINVWSLDDFQILKSANTNQPKTYQNKAADVKAALEKPSDIFDQELPF